MKFGQMKPGEINADLPDLPQPRHARGLGRQHARSARNLACTTCHSVHAPKSIAHQLVKPTETQVCVDVSSAAGGQDRTRRRAHAGARRQDVVLARATTRTARSATSRPQGRQLRQRVVHELSRRDARTDALGARAGARELRDLPRSARIVERPDARGPHADALPALSHRDANTRRRSTTTTPSRPTRATGCSAGRA